MGKAICKSGFHGQAGAESGFMRREAPMEEHLKQS